MIPRPQSPSANFKLGDLGAKRGGINSETPADYEVAYAVIPAKPTMELSGSGQGGPSEARYEEDSVDNGSVPSLSLAHKQEQAVDSTRGSQEDLLTHFN